jgi:tRNA G26 N,N-dimethylase Trm1
MRTCIDCGRDISSRGNRVTRCESCLGPVYLQHLAQRKLAQQMKRDTSKKLNRPAVTTGKKRVCQDCHRDSHDIYARWAPVYSETDSQGREVGPVILCLDCYLKRCDVA